MTLTVAAARSAWRTPPLGAAADRRREGTRPRRGAPAALSGGRPST